MLIRRLARGTGVMLCAAILTGSASAGDKPKDDFPGNSGSAPGQQKKADPAPAAVPAPAPAPAAAAAKPTPPAAKATGADKPRPAKSPAAKEARAAHKASRKEAKKPAATPRGQAKQQGTSRGRSAEAHHHVIVCHRTGSASNPYVVINIPLTAWHEAHSPQTGSHPPLDGRSDVLLKDPASRPGSKDGFTKDDCPGATPQAQPPAGPVKQKPAKAQDHVLICHRTGSESKPYVLINIARQGWENGHRKHEGDVLLRQGVRPGEKETAADIALAERSCRAVSAVAATAPTTTTTATGTATTTTTGTATATTTATAATSGSTKVASASPADSPGARTAAPASVAGATAAAAPGSAGRAEAVAAPQTAQVAAARRPESAKKRPTSGVLGAVKTVQQTATTTLPFTGIQLWVAALLAGAFLGSGLLLRRVAAGR